MAAATSRSTSSTVFPAARAAAASSSRTRSVLMRPGARLLMRMPWGANSKDRVFVSATTPERNTLLRTRLGMGTLTPEVMMVMMRPHLCGSMRGTAPRMRRTALMRFWWKACSHCASVSWRADPWGGPPALATRMSSRPKWDCAAPRSRSTSSARATSATTGITRRPVLAAISSAAPRIASSRRLPMTTSAPASANPDAMARPNPALAPDTTATRPERSIFIVTVPGSKNLTVSLSSQAGPQTRISPPSGYLICPRGQGDRGPRPGSPTRTGVLRRKGTAGTDRLRGEALSFHRPVWTSRRGSRSRLPRPVRTPTGLSDTGQTGSPQSQGQLLEVMPDGGIRFLLPAGKPVVHRQLSLQPPQAGPDLAGHPSSFPRCTGIHLAGQVLRDPGDHLCELSGHPLPKAHRPAACDECRRAVNGNSVPLPVLPGPDGGGVPGRHELTRHPFLTSPPAHCLHHSGKGEVTGHAVELPVRVQPVFPEVQVFQDNRFAQEGGRIHHQFGQNTYQVVPPESGRTGQVGHPNVEKAVGVGDDLKLPFVLAHIAWRGDADAFRPGLRLA